jgi:hypothetical protein
VGCRTWRETLLQLLGLVGILEDERVDEPLAPDLELDVVRLLVLLYAGGCSLSARILYAICVSPIAARGSRKSSRCAADHTRTSQTVATGEEM